MATADELSLFDHYVGLALKGLILRECTNLHVIPEQEHRSSM